MANIYLRLPQMMCEFFRHRFNGDGSLPDTPVKFAHHDPVFFILQHSVHFMANHHHGNARCFSQQEWKNMLVGKRSNGEGVPLLRRKASQWLEYREVCCLSGSTVKITSENYDYLCIALPGMVYNGGKPVRTTNSFNLEYSAIDVVETYLRTEFKMAVCWWMRCNDIFCLANGIKREKTAAIERFLNFYDITVSPNEQQRDSLRQQVTRWMTEMNDVFSEITIEGKKDIERFDRETDFPIRR